MDPLLQKVTVGESKIFHGVDRELYTVLVRDLCRNPLECLQIMGLWLWLERLGTSQVINKVRAMPPTIIDILADEAIICLKLLNNGTSMSFDADDVPFTNNILKKTVSLQFFINYQDIVLKEIHDLVIEVCIPVLADIVETARSGVPEGSTQNTRTNPVPAASGSASSSSSSSNPPRAPGAMYYTDPFALNFSALSIKGEASSSSSSSPSNPPRSPSPAFYANPFDFNFSGLSIQGDANVPPLRNRAPPAHVDPRAPPAHADPRAPPAHADPRASSAHVDARARKFSALSIPGVANATPRPQNRAQQINRPEYSRPVVPPRQTNRPDNAQGALVPRQPQGALVPRQPQGALIPHPPQGALIPHQPQGALIPHQPNRLENAQRVLAPRQPNIPEHSRTMFATFSKGYPVSEAEIKQFFTTLLGECIQGLHMQEVEPEEQPLYARIVFANQSFIRAILNGQGKAKFNINGKHVWIRRFVPRNGRDGRAPAWVPPRLRDAALQY